MAEQKIDFFGTEVTEHDIQIIKENTDKYSNPSNTDEIMEELKNAKTMGEVKELVDRVFPEWFVTTMDSFSTDYSQFNDTWSGICKKIGVKQAQIIIVEEVERGDNYSLIQNFAECFTKAGFAVRKKMQFIPCAKCNKALPSLLFYNMLKEKKFPVLDSWNSNCQKCM
jgi:hypothetical protein